MGVMNKLACWWRFLLKRSLFCLILAGPISASGQDANEHTIVNKDGQARYTNVRYAYAVSYSPAIFEAALNQIRGMGKNCPQKTARQRSLYMRMLR
jgi:hypothetical protein